MLRKAEQLLQFVLGEGSAFGRALHFDEGACRRHHDVHVCLGADVLGVFEVEHRHTVDDADRHRRARLRQRMRSHDLLLHETRAGIVQRDVRAADRGCACATVRLQHVAVQGDLHLAESAHVGDRAQRATDEALDLQRAPGLLPLGRLAADALSGGAREHRILGGDPPLAGASHPPRYVFFDRRGAQHAGAPEAHQHRSRSELGVVPLERDGAEVVRHPAVMAGLHSS